MKTLIYIIRHGESIGNSLRRCLGHTDLGLTKLGLAQADATARALADIECAAIYSSDLSRAMQTAEPHSKLRGMEIIPRRELREIYLGEWENQAVDDIIAEYGEKFTVEWREHFGVFTSPSGESVPQLRERIHAAVVDIARAHLGQTVIITTHAAAIRALWGKISNIAPEDLAGAFPFPSNASYSVMEYDGERLCPISYSIDSHLADMCTTWRD